MGRRERKRTPLWKRLLWAFFGGLWLVLCEGIFAQPNDYPHYNQIEYLGPVPYPYSDTLPTYEPLPRLEMEDGVFLVTWQADPSVPVSSPIYVDVAFEGIDLEDEFADEYCTIWQVHSGFASVTSTVGDGQLEVDLSSQFATWWEPGIYGRVTVTLRVHEDVESGPFVLPGDPDHVTGRFWINAPNCCTLTWTGPGGDQEMGRVLDLAVSWSGSSGGTVTLKFFGRNRVTEEEYSHSAIVDAVDGSYTWTQEDGFPAGELVSWDVSASIDAPGPFEDEWMCPPWSQFRTGGGVWDQPEIDAWLAAERAQRDAWQAIGGEMGAVGSGLENASAEILELLAAADADSSRGPAESGSYPSGVETSSALDELRPDLEFEEAGEAEPIEISFPLPGGVTFDAELQVDPRLWVGDEGVLGFVYVARGLLRSLLAAVVFLKMASKIRDALHEAKQPEEGE